MPDWAVERVAASPAALHEGAAPRPGQRVVRVCRATAPALVIGSAQPRAHVDEARARAAGVPVVRRRSGGGAVLVDGEGLAWVDVSLPAGDDLWHDDVGLAFDWLGQTWVRALEAIGVAGAAAHRGALRTSPWSSRVCFACTPNGPARRYHHSVSTSGIKGCDAWTPGVHRNIDSTMALV